MDSLAVNKTVAAVLVAGIAYMSAAILSDVLVRPHRLAESVVRIEGVPAPAAAAAGGAAASGTSAAKEAAGGAPAGGGDFMTMLASSNAGAGESDAKKLCSSCHSFTEGGKALVGPNLYGVVGAPHGHMEGYPYSAAIKGKDGPWTFGELNEWLRKPSAYAPGTKMGFAGISDDKTRADVINYLHTLSHDPMPMPTPGAAPAAATQATPAAGAASPTQPPPAQGGAAQ